MAVVYIYKFLCFLKKIEGKCDFFRVNFEMFVTSNLFPKK